MSVIIADQRSRLCAVTAMWVARNAYGAHERGAFSHIGADAPEGLGVIRLNSLASSYIRL
jgi:hypothetical protein